MKNIYNKIKGGFSKTKIDKNHKLRNEFLPEALEIIEKPTSPIGPVMIILVTSIMVVFLIWSFFGKIDTVATARGSISTITGIQNIQSEHGGVVSEILVKEGDEVKAGQAIFTLDDAINEINVNSVKEGVDLLEFENQLLEKVRNRESITEAVQGDLSSNQAKVFDYVRSIERNFNLQKAESQNETEQLRLQVVIEETNLKKFENNKNFLIKNKENMQLLFQKDGPDKKSIEKIEIALAQKEKEYLSYKALYEGGVIPRAELDAFASELDQLKKEREIQISRSEYTKEENNTKLSELDNQIIAAENDYNSQKNIIQQAQQRLEQANTKLESLETEFVTNISKLIVENSDKLSVQKANLDIQTINLSRQTLVSPVDGIVKTLDVKTKGGVIAPMQIAATVLSYEDQLVADVNILNKDIGYIKTGQNVTIKLDTFNFQKYGKLEGKLIFVGPDAVLDERKGLVYKGKVALDDKNFKKRNPEIVINSGMECTAEIKISERRVIEFFLEPVFEHFDGSLGVK